MEPDLKTIDSIAALAADLARSGRDVTIKAGNEAILMKVYETIRSMPTPSGTGRAWGQSGRMLIRFGGGDRGGIAFAVVTGLQDVVLEYIM